MDSEAPTGVRRIPMSQELFVTRHAYSFKEVGRTVCGYNIDAITIHSRLPTPMTENPELITCTRCREKHHGIQLQQRRARLT